MVYSKSTSVCETEGGGANPTSGYQVTMSENKGTKTKLADRIRKHAEAHPNDKRPQEIVAKLDAIRAELFKE